MADTEVEIKGLSELQTALEELPHKVAQGGIKKALRAGAEPIYQRMVSSAPRYIGGRDYPPIGWLAEHFGTRVKLGDELSGSAFIGPQGKMDYPMYVSGAFKIVRNAKGKAIKVGRIAVATVTRFFEFGTAKMTKKPFMTQAFETEKENAVDAMVASLDETIQQAVEEAPKGPNV